MLTALGLAGAVIASTLSAADNGNAKQCFKNISKTPPLQWGSSGSVKHHAKTATDIWNIKKDGTGYTVQRLNRHNASSWCKQKYNLFTTGFATVSEAKAFANANRNRLP